MINNDLNNTLLTIYYNSPVLFFPVYIIKKWAVSVAEYLLQSHTDIPSLILTLIIHFYGYYNIYPVISPQFICE